MPRMVFRHRLPCSPQKAWEDFRSPAHLARVSFPFLRLAAPSVPARWEMGQSVTMKVSLFCFIPWSTHTIEFRSIDDSTLTALTDERGGAIQTWKHHVRIEPEGSRCLCTDTIDFEAGRWNTFVWVFSQALYRFRYLRWKLTFV
jgi:hypothetical protein